MCKSSGDCFQGSDSPPVPDLLGCREHEAGKLEQGLNLAYSMLGQFNKALGGKLGDLISLDKWVGPNREESIPAQRNIITPQDLLEEDDGREAILQTLESAFYQKDFDAVVHQLQLLPPLVDNTVIDDIVESRTSVLEVLRQIGFSQ